ncbi:MAG: tyrosine-type recombinase/integrase [Nanoarchaeota archaeon]|nr:tyrosine-type recombinase/integrase [Nanoarchaeota archaeon]
MKIKKIEKFGNDSMENLRLELRLRGYSEKTRDAYVFYNRKFLRFIGKTPKYVRKSDIMRYICYMLDRGLKKNSINLAISSLLFYYREILKRRFQIHRLKKSQRFYPVLTRKELNRLFTTAKNKKHLLLLKFLYSTGVRISEAVNIRIEDIDYESEIIIVRSGKGNKDRIVKMGERLSKAIQDYLHNRNIGSEYLFEKEGAHIAARTGQAIVKNHAKIAGIVKNVTPHTFRRSYATHLFEDKVDMEMIQKMMGHNNCSTTKGYIRTAKIDFNEFKAPLDSLA